MTKRELDLLRNAISALRSANGWDSGMEILLKLAGLRSPAAEAVKQAKPITLDQLRGLPEGPFRYREEGQR